MKINELETFLKIYDENNIPVLISGYHGIGKSEVVENYAKQNNYHFELLMLSHQEVGDLIGLPINEEVKGETLLNWTKPIWLHRIIEKRKIGVRTLLFLDELNRANVEVLQSCLQLILRKELHEHKLPEDTLIISAINPSDDDLFDYQTNSLDPALFNRFAFITLDIDVDSWLKWGDKNNVDKVILDFIKLKGVDYLFSHKENEMQTTTPRSWTQYSKVLTKINNVNLLSELGSHFINRTINEEFITYYKRYDTLITNEEVNDFLEETINKKNKLSLVKNKFKKMNEEQKNEMIERYFNYIKENDFNEDSILYFLLLVNIIKKETQSFLFKSLISDNKNINIFISNKDVKKKLSSFL